MQLSPEQFHTLFDRAAQPVLLVQDGVITQCSSRAEGLIAPGSPIRELLPPDAVLQELIAAAPTVLPLRLRTGYVTAQVQPLEGALLLFLPVGDDDACTSALSRAAQAVSAPLPTLLSASGTISRFWRTWRIRSCSGIWRCSAGRAISCCERARISET